MRLLVMADSKTGKPQVVNRRAADVARSSENVYWEARIEEEVE